MSKHSIIPASLAIVSMRDNGYKTAAHAIAELIDNSIQARVKDRVCNIQLICIDKTPEEGQRKRPFLHEVGIYDNGKGMNQYALQQALQFGGSQNRDDPDGIGRFGMGLPSASISQCRRLDVYSWQKGEVYHTYLDIDKIENGELESVPSPVPAVIPQKWRDAISDNLDESGTLAIWSNLDRVNWKTSKSLYQHSERLIGRMYRYFIATNKVTIRFKSFVNDISLRKVDNELFKTNDPLYLMENTTLPDLPGNYKNEAFFELHGEPQVVDVELLDGTSHPVTIKYSKVVKSIHSEIKNHANTQVGRTAWGKHAESNIGISIVRAGRELEMVKKMLPNDTRDRWYGIEVSFGPALDELFGVTNNKQAAVNFDEVTLANEAELEGVDTNNTQELHEFKEQFRMEKSYRYWMYKITSEIKKNLTALVSHSHSLTEKDVNKGKKAEQLTPSEKLASKVTEARVSDGYETAIDKTIKETPPEQREIEISQVLTEKAAMSKEEAKDLAKTLITSNCNVKFVEVSFSGNLFFDITREAALILIQINTNHPFYEFYKSVPDEQRELLKLILVAWARCEDEAAFPKLRTDMENMRLSWGSMVSEYLYELQEQ